MISKNCALAIFIVVLFLNTANSTSCRTPNYDRGECKPIEECPSLQSATFRIDGQFDIKETIKLLNRSLIACNSKPGEYLVCCANEQYLNDVKLLDKNYDILPDPDTCGMSHSAKDILIGRIIGGFNVSEGQFPWMVALGYDNGNGKLEYKCGGSLITSNHILTAAHCVFGVPLIQVVSGTLNPYKNPSLIGKVVKSYIHEEYSHFTNVNDIAIIKVQWRNSKGENMNFMPSKTADVICLPKTENLRKNTFERFNLFISGWGDQEYDNPASASQTLLALQVPIERNSDCEKKYRDYNRTIISSNVLCAGFKKGGHDSCKGDSGGPLMFPERNSNGEFIYYQIGILSKGYKCAVRGIPAIYTRVGNYIDWILKTIRPRLFFV
ncbi:venom protease-like [Chrysoperla carnea]|uniref:venom protease-like n=1 Tax=Chrysoperla carnea TaxID=189513 RepID=UPI001D0856DA|nr:venom protease-like [Chrysoperla carnea]